MDNDPVSELAGESLMIGIMFSKSFFYCFCCMADVIFIGQGGEQDVESCLHKKRGCLFETTSLVGAEGFEPPTLPTKSRDAQK